MNIVYGNQTQPYRGPEAANASLVSLWRRTAQQPRHCGVGGGVAVKITFKPGTLGGGLKWVPRECPYLVLKLEAHQKTDIDCRKSIDDCIDKCGWFDIEMGKGRWLRNATATIAADKQSIVIAPPVDADGCLSTAAPTGVRYLYADWPVATLYNENDLPALPFLLEL
jgi:hypothetical protein